MGKITRKTVGREEASKPSRKRRKKELDRIHLKILKARTQLDNVGKEKTKGGQRKQGRAKTCNRLLPKLVPGIYRNGIKGKDISKAGTSENIFETARLNADALKLFNGNTPESKRIIEISSDDETTEKSPNKDFVKHCLEWTPGTLEQSGASPVLGKIQCQNQCVKKKREDDIFQKLNLNKIDKQKTKIDLKDVFQKEDVCKRRLFQNDNKQSANKVDAIAAQSQTCNNTDQTKDNTVNEKKIEQSCSKDSENKSLDPLMYYLQFCNINSAENFESNCLSYQPDPLTTTIQRLRNTYADTFRLQLLREKNKQKLTNVESPAVSVEYQACTTSSASQFSPVTFEVPKCIKNHTFATHLQDVSQKTNNSHFMQNMEFQKSSGITQHSSTSCLSKNTFATYDTNSFIVENHENNDNQYAKQSSSNVQLPKGLSFCLVNEKNPINLDSQAISNYNNILKNNQNENNFHIDTVSDHRNVRVTDNTKLKNFILTNDDVLSAKEHLSKDYFHENLSTENCPSEDTLLKCDDKINMKNIKRVPTILRRCNVIINKNNHSVQSSFQINDNCAEDWHKKSAYVLNISPLSAPISTVNLSRDRTKLPESRIGPMEVKDIRESQVDELDIRSNELNKRNGFSRLDKSLHSQAFKTLHDTNAYPEKLPQQEQFASNMRKQNYSKYRPINHLQRVNFLNIDESAKRMQQTIQQAKSHTRQMNNADERDQNQNILFNGVSDTTIPTAVLSFPPNVQTDKKSKEFACEETYDVNCMKKQTSTCRCNEQYIYLDSTHCPRKYNTLQARHFYEGTVQPTASYDTKSYNNDINNCVNDTQNILLPVEQKYNPRMYLKVTDDQHHAVLLQNVTQPIKYLAVKNDSGVQRIPIYINDGNVKVAENVPLKVIALVDSNTQLKAFPQEVVPHVVPQVIPLQTNNPQFDDFATHKTSNQFVVKHLNPANTILLNPNSQSNIWYASNL